MNGRPMQTNLSDLPKGQHHPKPHMGWKRWCAYCTQLKAHVDALCGWESAWPVLTYYQRKHTPCG